MGIFEFRPNGPLFHFCGLDAFKGIVETKSLWFSDLQKSNDPREVILGRDLFLAPFQEVRASLTMERGIYTSILYAKFVQALKKLRPFSCSFSRENDLLPMWELYAERSTGFSIGFRPAALASIQARLQLANYLGEDTIENFIQLVDRASTPLRGVEKLPEDKKAELWQESLTAILSAAISLKHSSWSHEREVRMVHMRAIDPKTNEWENQLLEELDADEGYEHQEINVKTRNREDGPVDYIPFTYGKRVGPSKNPSGAIAMVTLGPKCKWSKAETSEFLTENGFSNFEVRESDCAIR